ncbi:hypothetical protein BCR32DRAFT_291407 [Anaeromyces robustus]|uniref:PD-(D/E)XK nuclease family transposase n=1 Tax=Anaeromyces robustus TaxID=1754192 RepID=A0A1Y1XEY7_9FUNG|nr:hypothetical protein BCR32DRAFT_291407 [Anaeromyces robustus]|eukprot:ORX84341.1 hypothetical protein BCR32DRAFT_291407 [Anaeromyces robustus]
MSGNSLNKEEKILNNEKGIESEKLIVKINPKVDIAFKSLFINNKKMMINFLNNIFDSEIIIDDLEYKNIEIVPVLATNAIINNTDDENSEDSENTTNETKIGKLGRMDTLLAIKNKNFKRKRKFEEIQNQGIFMTAKTNHNKLVNIEIQFNKTGHMFKRSLYYSSGIIFHSLPQGRSYGEIPDVIMINLLNYNLFKDMNKRHWHFELKERETNKGEGFEDLLNIHFFELQKYMNIAQEELENKFTWFFFLNDPNNEYFRNKETPAIFKKAREKLLTLKGDNNFYQIYLQREKDYYDVVAAREEGEAVGEARGEARGEAKGLIKGRVEGKENKALEVAVNMILDKFKEDIIEQYSGLSEAKINILKEFLNEPNCQIDVLKSKLNLKIDEKEILEIIENCKVKYEEREMKKRKA